MDLCHFKLKPSIFFSCFDICIGIVIEQKKKQDIIHVLLKLIFKNILCFYKESVETMGIE